jgi:hypothetical protein
MPHVVRACDAVEVVLGVLRDQNASNRERMETALG